MASRTFRLVQTSLAIGAFFLLTGAKGEGCGSSGGTGGGSIPADDDTVPSPVCEPGTHLEENCSATPDGAVACAGACVPDACPPGTTPEWMCGGVAPDARDTPVANPTDAPPAPDGADCPPTPEDCFFTCIPVDPCGPGAHQEFVCEDDGPPMPTPYDADGSPDHAYGSGGETPPSPGCYPICVPDDSCPPGSVAQTVCEAGGCADCPEPPSDPVCWTECVPASVCPPGTVEQTVCDPILPGADGDLGAACYTECVGGDICPPPSIPEVTCFGEGPDDPCTITCVDGPLPGEDSGGAK